MTTYQVLRRVRDDADETAVELRERAQHARLRGRGRAARRLATEADQARAEALLMDDLLREYVS